MKRGRKRSEIVLASLAAEYRVLAWMRSYFPEAIKAKTGEKFDIVCGDKRIEVKVCEGLIKNDVPVWAFNIHRHGTINEEGVHAYVLRLENVPGFKAAIHLVIPAPIGKPTIQITMRGLMAYWGRFFNRVDVIAPGATSAYKRTRRRSA